ncbi:MAG TPA: hypothetical protein DDY18_09670 [Flavobacterium sp.]|jgi:S-adenosylmethionine:diacylglycerol 3-amino-3-carboxypropyl transferase|nr:hypothetical protein [Flavobacterium sp.]
MNQELKQKIKNSMQEHLKAKGWPDNLDYNGIIQELPAMWDKLEKEGLLKDLIARGFTYANFTAIALQKKMEQETMDEVMSFFTRGRP